MVITMVNVADIVPGRVTGVENPVTVKQFTGALIVNVPPVPACTSPVNLNCVPEAMYIKADILAGAVPMGINVLTDS